MHFTKQKTRNIAEGCGHLAIPESVHNRVECTVAIVTKLDKLEHAIRPLGGREVLWVIRADHCHDKEREPGDNKKSCDESKRDRKFQIFFESLPHSSVLGNFSSSRLGASETVNGEIRKENDNKGNEEARGSHEKRVNLLPAVELHRL